MEKFNNLAILILAAGTSSRLGEPKQLLKMNNKTFIQIAIEKALELSSNVTVVLGHRHEDLEKVITPFSINVIKNPNYSEGMGSSIAYGISKINNAQRVLIMLCDQPLIPLEHFNNLIKKSNLIENTIICSKYKNKNAVPTIFPKEYFKKLEELKEEEGARKLFKNNSLDFVVLEDNYSIDIDTKEDWIKFNTGMFKILCQTDRILNSKGMIYETTV